MAMFGLFGMVVALAAILVSIGSLVASSVLGARGRASGSETAAWAGAVGSVLAAVALTFCCGLLVFCFLTEDPSIRYVLENQSHAEGALGVLYRVSGLWAGREGSLLFWGWLISVFNAVVAARVLRKHERLDGVALLVSSIVLLAFVSVSLFSESNMPFTATEAQYFDANGQLRGAALLWGMNSLLEHWAMAIHPPTLFVGYAGLTIPFAYAIAALIVNDASDAWVRRAQRYAMFSWLFLGVGIGLGAVWAYVVLGWGGYWGWDPVENASLLSWMMALALIHSFTVYRQRGGFKRWSVMCACLSFSFVVVGTFITRSGIVQSVHAFSGDPISLELFGGLIIVSVVAGIVGLVLRWKSFAADDDIETMASKNAAYYFNNVIMVVFTLLLTYLTVASALPSFLPFGGMSVSTGTYNAIARPIGIVYCLILAVCPLLSWGRTDRAAFLKHAKVPFVCALMLFAALMAYWAIALYPAYDAVIQAGGTQADELLSEGPVWYYNGLAVVGIFVASLLFFNTLFLMGRMVCNRVKATGDNPIVAFFKGAWRNSSAFGGYIAHAGIAIVLVGLIGSSMYVTEVTGYLPYDEEADQTEGNFQIQDYELRYTGNVVEEINSGTDVLYQVEFDVYDISESSEGTYVGHLSPSVQLDAQTQQSKLNASVVGTPMHDLFVAYRGVSEDGSFSLDVRINPLISWVWVGFFVLMAGTALAFVGRRAGGPSLRSAKPADPSDDDSASGAGAESVREEETTADESAERPAVTAAAAVENAEGTAVEGTDDTTEARQ